MPADAVFTAHQALPFAGVVAAPPSAVIDATRDPLGDTHTGVDEAGVNKTLPFRAVPAIDDDDEGGATPEQDFAPTERLDALEALEPLTTEVPTHLRHMTVEQYAALCAECTVSPQWTAQIHARYGVRSPVERIALDQHWQGHFSSDPELSNTYRWHYRRYEEWAKTRASGG